VKKIIMKHKDGKANCQGYRKEGPYTFECYAHRTPDGEEIVKASVSSVKKRKRDDSIPLVVEKKAKVVATVSGAPEAKRIWEINFEKKEDL
jgi:hypothetical protein